MEKPNLKHLLEAFQTKGIIKDVKPLSGGLINASYIVETDGTVPGYVLQKKNGSIFKDVPAMMDNILKVTHHIAGKVEKAGGDVDKEVMQVVLTHDGLPYYRDENGDYWTLTVFIPDTVTYDKADTPELAYKGGEGIGLFQQQLSDFSKPLAETIPGFHNMKVRFEQWDEAVRADRAGRVASLQPEIEWIEERRPEIMKFWQLVEEGVLPRRVTHNDTKISNILFDKNGKVQCVIDLDTVMPNTVLADFGDAIRTFANTTVEDDPNTDKVSLNKEIYKAYTEGFLSKTKNVLLPAELEYLAFGPRYISFEQALRFLMDYINGDTYYHIDYPEHNLIRTHNQQKLVEDMEKNYDFMKQTVDNY